MSLSCDEFNKGLLSICSDVGSEVRDRLDMIKTCLEKRIKEGES